MLALEGISEVGVDVAVEGENAVLEIEGGSGTLESKPEFDVDGTCGRISSEIFSIDSGLPLYSLAQLVNISLVLLFSGMLVGHLLVLFILPGYFSSVSI